MSAQVTRMASKQHPLWEGKGESSTVISIDEVHGFMLSTSTNGHALSPSSTMHPQISAYTSSVQGGACAQCRISCDDHTSS